MCVLQRPQNTVTVLVRNSINMSSQLVEVTAAISSDPRLPTATHGMGRGGEKGKEGRKGVLPYSAMPSIEALIVVAFLCFMVAVVFIR